MTVKNKPEGGRNLPNQLYHLDTDLLIGPNAPVDYRFPVYIRFEPSENEDFWSLHHAYCLVNPGGSPTILYTDLFKDGESLWLGNPYGKYCYLRSYLAELRPP